MKWSVSLVGAGNVATALAVWLHGAGYRVDEIIVRSSSLRRARALAARTKGRAVALDRASFGAAIVWICVPDDAIAACASDMAQHAVWNGKTVLHSSGALGSDILTPLRAAGAVVASVHPMMTFVRGVRPPAAAGIPFAIEGDARALSQARRILSDLGGEVVAIKAENKALYHALGAFVSPLIVAELAVAESIARAAGIAPRQARRIIAPILRRTLENYLAHGPASAFSGPLVRGDIGTIRKHLDVLKTIPHAREAYIALARTALREFPLGRRKALRELLRA